MSYVFAPGEDFKESLMPMVGGWQVVHVPSGLSGMGKERMEAYEDLIQEMGALLRNIKEENATDTPGLWPIERV